MKELVILPTGTCFDDTMAFIRREAFLSDDLAALRKRYVIVHGICRADDSPPTGYKHSVSRPDRFYSHAWIIDQTDGDCITFGIREDDRAMLMMRADINEFFASFDVYETWTYTIEDLGIAAVADLHSGPYAERLFNLCADHDRDPRPTFIEQLGIHTKHKDGAP